MKSASVTPELNEPSPSRQQWPVTPLKYLLREVVAGGTPDTGRPDLWADGTEGTPWVAIGDMTANPVISNTAKRISDAGIRESRLRLLPAGTLLYSIYASLGKVAVLRTPAVTNQAILGLLPQRLRVDQDFLKWALIAFEPQLATLSSSNTQDNLNAAKVRRIPVPTPPLNVQQSIARYLDRRTGTIDSLLIQKQRLLSCIEVQFRSLVTRAVVTGLRAGTSVRDSGDTVIGKFAAHWDVKRISVVADKLCNGFVGPTRDILVDEGVPYLQSLHIKGGRVRFDKPYYVSRPWLDRHARIKLRQGDLVIVQTGDIGQVAVVPAEWDGAGCHALIIFRPKPSVAIGSFLGWFFQSHVGRELLLREQTGALHPHLEVGKIRDVLVTLPPLDEQADIVRYLDELDRSWQLRRSCLERQLVLLREYRLALITEAVMGRLDLTKDAA